MSMELDGIFAIDKPKGYTSNDAVQIAKRASGGKKVGHGGTLDPLATGVLVIAVGREHTRKLADVVASDKEYEAIVRLGRTSTTDDEEGEKTDVSAAEPTGKEITKVLGQFIGTIEQVPPAYSAVKVRGTEAYKRVRRGEEVRMESRQVEIRDIRILSYEYPDLEISVTTGKGAYIRSLARDIGQALGTGAYLADLRRTRVGKFGIEDAIFLEALKMD